MSLLAGISLTLGNTLAASTTPMNFKRSTCQNMDYKPPPPPPPGNTNAGLKPSMFHSHGRSHYYQLPATSGAPKGTLLVLPGCARWGPGFWPYGSPGCDDCVGLTEDVAHTKQALARGYAILVGWPVDLSYPNQYCWSAKDDGDTITKILLQFLEAFRLRTKPVYVLGASSGGSVALKFQSMLEAQRVPVHVSGILAEVSTNLEVQHFAPKSKRHPPIVWVSMSYPNEIKKARTRVADYKKYAPAAMVVSDVHKVLPTYFSDRHPRISPLRSAHLVDAMHSIKLLRTDGIFAYDIKENKGWIGKLYTAAPWLKQSPEFALGPSKKSAILQAMQVAQAGHEHVCDYLTAALMWFEQSGATNFTDLVRKYRVVKPSALTMERQLPGAEPTPVSAFAYGHR